MEMRNLMVWDSAFFIYTQEVKIIGTVYFSKVDISFLT